MLQLHSTSFCRFAFLTVVFLLDATLSVQAFQVTDIHSIGSQSGVFLARKVGAVSNTLAVKAKLPPRSISNEEWKESLMGEYLRKFLKGEHFTADNLTSEYATLRNIEQKLEAVPEQRRHLVLQARNYADLQHNVTLLYGLSAEFAIVFPLFKDGDLCRLLQKAEMDAWNYPITEASILSISRGILNGLKLLHQTAGYVHGDIKPSNILLQRTKFEILASIADFSTASPIDEVSLHRATKGYAPPEQYQKPVRRTVAFDVFSFGSVLYQLALGKYLHVSALTVLQRKSWKMPDTVPLGLPETLRSIVIRCWNEIPHERPTVDQILEALDVYALEARFSSSPIL